MKLISRVALAATLVVVAPVAQSQQRIVLGPTPVIGGAMVQCGGANTVVAPIADLAYAIPGEIQLSPRFFNEPAPVQVFVYAHECAHQFVGSDEAAADCWAIRTGRDQGWLNHQATNLVAQSVAASPGDWTHAPGPARIQHMAACYYTP